MAISELDKVFKDAQAKALDVANELKSAYAKEKDALDYELSILRRNGLDEIESYKKSEIKKVDEAVEAKKSDVDKYTAKKFQELTDKQNEISKLQEIVEGEVESLKSIPLLKEQIDGLKKVVEEKNSTINGIQRENSYQKKIMETEFDGLLNRKDTQIDNLESKVDALESQNAQLEEKLENAYRRITEMANNTAQSASKDATISALKDVASAKQQTGK